MITPSPLRYPGGKTVLYSMVSDLIRKNDLERGHYAEPYAGGAGLALSLLLNNVMRHIHINDVDPAVWAFWDSILNHPTKFIRLIEKTEVTIEEWHKQRAILESKRIGSLRKGFAFFFLNRTNRSGIIQKAGVIGGLKQDGNYKIDCRFNKKALIQKIRVIADYKHRITLTKYDAVDFLDYLQEKLPEKSLIYIDPPYYNKGSSLYTSFYHHEDHAQVAEVVSDLKTPWFMTYDNTPEISELYPDFAQIGFHLNYSVQTKRKGKELLILSNHINASKDYLQKHLNIAA